MTHSNETAFQSQGTRVLYCSFPLLLRIQVDETRQREGFRLSSLRTTLAVDDRECSSNHLHLQAHNPMVPIALMPTTRPPNNWSLHGPMILSNESRATT